jgi:hypothetical protein
MIIIHVCSLYFVQKINEHSSYVIMIKIRTYFSKTKLLKTLSKSKNIMNN